MTFTQIPNPPLELDVPPSADFIPSPWVPAGLSLRNTITTSGAPNKSAWTEWVYVVAVGGGGSGSAYSEGGGGGACIQGWLRSEVVNSITIGAGGPVGSSTTGVAGSPTSIGPLRAGGGGGGTQAGSWEVALVVEPGAGQGGVSSITSPSLAQQSAAGLVLAWGLFAGGRSSSVPGSAVSVTSGAGGYGTAGGNGLYGPAGGGGGNAAGGQCLSPTGAAYTGGALLNNLGGGGGAGILGNGAAASGTAAGAGGLGGGGGGGATNTPYLAGKGGNGAVLIFY